jgi:hypothetical protein
MTTISSEQSLIVSAGQTTNGVIVLSDGTLRITPDTIFNTVEGGDSHIALAKGSAIIPTVTDLGQETVSGSDVTTPGTTVSSVRYESVLSSDTTLGIANTTIYWHIHEIAEFNEDGNSNTLRGDDNGQMLLWEMNGSTTMAQQGAASITTAGQTQEIVAFNGDGNSELLWREGNDQVLIWEMNGTIIVGQQDIASADRRVAGTSDLNADGNSNSEILWRNGNGQVPRWETNGFTIDWDPAASLYAAIPGQQQPSTGEAGPEQNSAVLATGNTPTPTTIPTQPSANPQFSHAPILWDLDAGPCLTPVASHERGTLVPVETSDWGCLQPGVKPPPK